MLDDTTEGSEELNHLLEKIYRERGFDFREYRKTTLNRRLRLRLHARGADSYTDYARVLDQDPTEYEKLFNDLTINVTSFFRDEAAFKVLEETVLPELTSRDTQSSIRIWSAGCATGQEPYSIGTLLLERLGREADQREITILATDVDTRSLAYARTGFFAAKEVEGIRSGWLNRYFVHNRDGFHVHPALKRLVTFETHNLVSDPPYRDLDMVVCRNVLIYFTPALQTRVLKGFHEGLKEGGFLLLGKAEVPMGEAKRFFRCVDRKAKLYMKEG